MEVDGATLRCLVLGSFQPFLEALRGHEVISLSTPKASARREVIGQMPARAWKNKPAGFAPLGPTYDRVGAALAGTGAAWAPLPRLAPRGGHVLDVATGTGLVAAGSCGGIRGDRTRPEPRDAGGRAPSLRRRRSLINGSAEALPLDSESFDHLTVTHVLRYVADPGATLAELARAVRPGGVVAALDVRCPARPLWDLYVRTVLPLAGRLLRQGWREVGDFLGGSIRDFWGAIRSSASSSGGARRASTGSRCGG